MLIMPTEYSTYFAFIITGVGACRMNATVVHWRRQHVIKKISLLAAVLADFHYMFIFASLCGLIYMFPDSSVSIRQYAANYIKAR